MSRFADPKASGRCVLGDCECPGKPHDEDWIELRTEIGTQDALRVSEGNSLTALEVLIVSWNLLDNEGNPAPVDRAHLEQLFADTYEVLEPWITKNVRMATLPNGSGAHSGNGSRASASLSRTTRKRG